MAPSRKAVTPREEGAHMERPLVPVEQVQELASIYVDFDRAFNRARSRTAVDGGLMLLAIVDELRQLRRVIEGQGRATAEQDNG